MKKKSLQLLPRVVTSLILALVFISVAIGGLALSRPLVAQATAELPADHPGEQIYSRADHAIELLQSSIEFKFERRTNTKNNNISPSINGDGTKLAYVSDRNNDDQIFFTKPDKTITDKDSGQVNAAPSLNEAGNVIAFHSTGCKNDGCDNDDNYEILQVRKTSQNHPPVTNITSTPGTAELRFNLFPSIDNSGNMIAFLSNNDLEKGMNTNHNLQIFLYHSIFITKSVITQVTKTQSDVIANKPLALSGNGNFITFVANDDLDNTNGNSGTENNPEIFLYDINRDVFTQVTVTDSTIKNSQPTISDNGRFVAFVSDGDLVTGMNNDKNTEIFRYDRLSSEITQITETGSGISNKQPDISGNGLSIAYVSNSDGNDEIYLAHPAVYSTPQQVTSSTLTVINKEPSINTVGDIIAYASNTKVKVNNKANKGNFQIWTAKRDIVDLHITKVAQQNLVGITEPLTYTIVITNYGPENARYVTMTDRLPQHVNIISVASNIGGNCSHSPENSMKVITCTYNWLNTNQNRTITIVVTSTKASVITNSAQIANTKVDLDPSNNIDSVTTEVRSVSRLGISKTVTPTIAKKDATVTYTVVITNGGDHTATDVTLTDILPKELDPKEVIPSSNCNLDRTIICNLGNLDVGGKITVTIVSTVTKVAKIDNVATVTSTAFLPGENTTINISDTAIINLEPVTLTYAKIAPSSILAGSRFDYTIMVTNPATNTATAAGIVMTDTLPSQIVTDSVQISPPALCDDDKQGEITCNLDNLAPGDTQTIVLNVKHDGQSELYTNTATINAANPGFTESAFSSNSTDIEPATDLIVSKVVTPNVVSAGNPLTYTIVVDNLGPLGAKNVIVTDTLIADMPVMFEIINTIMAPQPSCNSVLDKLITCTLTFTSLEVGASLTTTILVTPSENGTISNGVTVTSNSPDPNPNNNTPPLLITDPDFEQSFLPVILKQK